MNCSKKQTVIFESGNELAAFAAKQINYHVMGYYPITPSTQIAEQLDEYKADGHAETVMIPADGEHGAAGICYGASVGGGRVFNATSANGLLYALEQLPVQSGTRFPMVLNVACRTVSGPLSIKGDHSDIMYALNAGWIILFAKDPQAVYDMNICALKIAEAVMLPVIVAFDGFFTSHQKRKTYVFENNADVQEFVGEYKPQYTALDKDNPVTIGSYMNEPDLLNNKFQLHMAMEDSRSAIDTVFNEYHEITGRGYGLVSEYYSTEADVVLLLLGSSFDTARAAVDKLRAEGKRVGVIMPNILRPWPKQELFDCCKNAKLIVVGDRQDSYGAIGGNLTLELRATLHECKSDINVISRVYGLSGRDFYVEDAIALFNEGLDKLGNCQSRVKNFDYFGHYPGDSSVSMQQYFEPINEKNAKPGFVKTRMDEKTGTVVVDGGLVRDSTEMPKRWGPGHGACPGCGIPVNVNLLLKGIEGNVVLLFHTGCGMVVTTAYPKTSFRVPYVHNLFQNGAATLSGLVEMFYERQRRGELPSGDDFTFVMVSGDGGMDIGMGPAIGSALRNHRMILFEYDNGGYMNTGFQLSYSTPKGSKSSTSHVGVNQAGKQTMHKDTPQIMAATNVPYIATVAESNPADFINKAAKAQYYAQKYGFVYMKAVSACPLNWGDNPRYERLVIESAVNCCYHPLYEIENGITKLTYNPETKDKKTHVLDWFSKMGRTRHLANDRYKQLVDEIQTEIDRRWERLKAMDKNPLL